MVGSRPHYAHTERLTMTPARQAYMSFEVYERTHEAGGKEHSVRIALSEGAHGMPLDTSLDAKHALQVLQRRCVRLAAYGLRRSADLAEQLVDPAH